MLHSDLFEGLLPQKPQQKKWNTGKESRFIKCPRRQCVNIPFSFIKNILITNFSLIFFIAGLSAFGFVSKTDSNNEQLGVTIGAFSFTGLGLFGLVFAGRSLLKHCKAPHSPSYLSHGSSYKPPQIIPL